MDVVRLMKNIVGATNMRRFSLLMCGFVATGCHATDVEQATFHRVNGLGVLSVEAPRPMAKAVETLSAQYGDVITYEDPKYAFAADSEDRASRFRRDYQQYPPGKAPTMVGPVGGTISVSFTANDTASILQQLVRTQVDTGTGGRFRIEKTGTVFHVVPSEVRDRTGAWVAQKSALDVPISLPAESRSANELLATICGAIADANNRGFRLANGPGPIDDDPPRYVVGAKQESARNVLVRAMKAMAPDTGVLTWLLYYDVETGVYYMNFVPSPSVAANSSSTNRQTQPSAPPIPAGQNAQVVVAPMSKQ